MSSSVPPTDNIERAVRDLTRARHAVALTGAGISSESGIPPFRGKGGVWERIDPMEYATIQAFQRNPKKVWQVLFLEMKTVLDQARPSAGHLGLARLEELGRLKTVITQNVDGLHQAAGNTDVIEFHGNFAWQRCDSCGRTLPSRELVLDELPPRCPCGGLWRPDCVLFGELIPFTPLARCQEIVATCDLMLVIGTSAVVQPAASLPAMARAAGATIIEINPEATPLTQGTSHYLIQGGAGEILSRIAGACP
ncbi:MAG: NAD-dependent deacylase [Desulfobacterales bacterium]